MNIKFEKMTLNDLDSIKNIFFSDFDDFWNYNVFKEELKSNSSYFVIAKNDSNEICGFAGIKIIVDEADIMNIAVKKIYRNTGIGSLLLNNLIEYIDKLKLTSITLEVNEINHNAIHLYEKFNFSITGSRKNYYGSNNGIIMTKKIN